MVYIDGYEISTAYLITVGVYLLMYALIVYCAYKHPINNGNREISIILAIFVPFVYIIWRAVERPLICTGYNSGLSLIFGCCLTPCFVLTLLFEDEQERMPYTANFVLQKV